MAERKQNILIIVDKKETEKARENAKAKGKSTDFQVVSFEFDQSILGKDTIIDHARHPEKYAGSKLPTTYRSGNLQLVNDTFERKDGSIGFDHTRKIKNDYLDKLTKAAGFGEDGKTAIDLGTKEVMNANVSVMYDIVKDDKGNKNWNVHTTNKEGRKALPFKLDSVEPSAIKLTEDTLTKNARNARFVDIATAQENKDKTINELKDMFAQKETEWAERDAQRQGDVVVEEVEPVGVQETEVENGLEME